MNDNEIDLRPDAPAHAGEVLRFRGQVQESEVRAALKASGVFRRVRVPGVAGGAAIALLGALGLADGDPVGLGFMVGGAVYGAVFCLLAPRRITSRGFKAAQAQGERECVVDDGGITVSCPGGEPVRMPWERMKRFHETPEIFAVVGRTGWKTCFFVLPKRLMPAPGQTELVGALLDSRLRRA